MKTTTKKLLAMLLALVMCMGLTTAQAYANDDSDDSGNSGDNAGLPPIAMIGETAYTDFASAISAANDAPGDTAVTLQADVSDAAVFTVSSDITLNLNGHTLTSATLGNGNQFITVSSGATLTVKDSSENKSGAITVDGSAGYYGFDVHGSLKMEGGAIQDGTTTAASSANYRRLIYVRSGGACEITGGAVTPSTSGYGYGLEVATGGTAAIGTSNSDNSAIKFVSGSRYLIKASGSITIYSGVFTNEGSVQMLYSEGSLSIYGGIFNGGSADIMTDSSKFAVYGGSFSSVVPSAACADGYLPTTTADSNGYYTVMAITGENAPVVLAYTDSSSNQQTAYFADPGNALTAAGKLTDATDAVVTVAKDVTTASSLAPYGKAKLVVASGATLTTSKMITVSASNNSGTWVEVSSGGAIVSSASIAGSSGNCTLTNNGSITCTYMTAKTVDSSGNGWVNTGTITLTSTTTASTLTCFQNSGTIQGQSGGEQLTVSEGSTLSIGNVTYAAGTYKWDASNNQWVADGPVKLLHTDNGTIMAAFYPTFSEAVDAAAEGDTIQLLDDLTTGVVVEIGTTLTLDLNGHSIEYGNSMINKGVITIAKGGNLTVKDSSDGAGGRINATFYLPAIYVKSGGAFTLESGSIMGNGSSNSGIWVGNADIGKTDAECSDAVVNIKGGSVYGSAYGITILGSNDETAAAPVLNISGGTITGGQVGIMGQGTYHYTEINISNGTVYGTEGPAIYHPQKGTLTISGGTITGSMGIANKGGTVTITGGTIIGTDEETSEGGSQNSGTTNTGAGIYIEDNYGFSPTVTITSNEVVVISEHGVAVLYYKEENATNANGYIKLSGGVYSSDPDDSYIVTDYDGHKILSTSETYAGYAGYYVVEISSHNYDGGTVTTAATCTTTGIMTYTCKLCGDARTETVAAPGHTLTHVEAVAATETTGGNIEYWYCSVCGKYFSDENAGQEITEADTVVAATGHTLTHVEAVAATETTDGNIEYWYCSVCGAYFSDEAGTAEIAAADTILPATGTTTTKEAATTTTAAETQASGAAKSATSPKTGAEIAAATVLLILFALGVCIIMLRKRKALNTNSLR